MDFCPRCGRYLQDYEYKCPECGYAVRENPNPTPSGYAQPYPGMTPEQMKKALFDKWFFVSFAICFALTFVVTLYWRFTFLFFCFPLFLPMGRISIATGSLLGISAGSILALMLRYMNLIVV